MNIQAELQIPPEQQVNVLRMNLSFINRQRSFFNRFVVGWMRVTSSSARAGFATPPAGSCKNFLQLRFLQTFHQLFCHRLLWLSPFIYYE
jgi:hypothetical protein